MDDRLDACQDLLDSLIRRCDPLERSDANSAMRAEERRHQKRFRELEADPATKGKYELAYDMDDGIFKVKIKGYSLWEHP